MSEPFIGEIRVVSFTYPPRGWAFCDGQLLPINQNQALFSILGTTYGGNGQTNFALPDLRGRVPVHVGSGITLGESAGVESVTLDSTQHPGHSHTLAVSSQRASLDDPTNAYWSADGSQSRYASTGDTTMAGGLVSAAGGQPHENRQPSLALNFVIALVGIYPSRN